jgi:CubicO group peptidase (beta-lactamase class C family)
VSFHALGRVAIALAAIALLGCRPRVVNAPTDAEIAARFVARADSLRQAARIPGLAIAIVRDTTIVLATGLGYADLERRVAVTPETPFNIASVTKPIAAVVALQLVEQGRLDLDRPMSRYAEFNEFCAAARERGGIFFDDLRCDAPLTLRHVLSMTANGVPGTKFFYNPILFSWASRPIMQVTDSSFSNLVVAHVLRPVGMTRSARINRALPLRPDLAADLAKPYHVDSSGAIVESAPPGPQGDGAAGGVVSTARDLARFDIALTRGTLLSDASRAAMWTATRSASGDLLPYGLGWFVETHQGEQLLWHTGLWEGQYSALYLKLPARRLTLILLANSDGLRWDDRLDEGAAGRSPFVRAFFDSFR